MEPQIYTTQNGRAIAVPEPHRDRIEAAGHVNRAHSRRRLLAIAERVDNDVAGLEHISDIIPDLLDELIGEDRG